MTSSNETQQLLASLKALNGKTINNQYYNLTANKISLCWYYGWGIINNEGGHQNKDVIYLHLDFNKNKSKLVSYNEHPHSGSSFYNEETEEDWNVVVKAVLPMTHRAIKKLILREQEEERQAMEREVQSQIDKMLDNQATQRVLAFTDIK